MTVRLPAEWEPQDGVLLAWPHENTDWAAVLPQIEPVFLQLATTISRYEQVLIVTTDPDSLRDKLEAFGSTMAAITLVQASFDDTWCRDFGPITVLAHSAPRLQDFVFNGWGNKFLAEQDNAITGHLQHRNLFAAPVDYRPLVLEGGSIESDGCGTLLTTSQCLLNPNRNPDYSKGQIEKELQETLGCRRILWLYQGHLLGDDTDAHIDTLARFAPNDTILYVACDDPEDEHYPALSRMAEELTAFRTKAGQPYRLLPLPWPAARFDDDGQRLPATYANFLIINGAVLVPTYCDPQDDKALATVRSAFPGREIIGIDCSAVILQHGSLHCLTMQLPQGVLS
ncbi:agmatine deiminase [Syntrophotalea acetylenivorans]|uniref:Agmatine deiminase n=1 Tax=Syntrophotalea acetylenivorans TaxID=1842532 RepID=A0A1L3GNF0_9BACT|nr:agmatine deiminase family protein [Syntrophotalea acetylenivorans]APG27431.1 agmatine deiminase [Syntrophotalea acetylenivorans]